MIMEIKSILIKDTTKEERIRIVQEGLNQCGGACDFCNGCDNLGGGAVDAFYEPYINGEKELRELKILSDALQIVICVVYARCFVEKIRKLPMQIISTVSGFIWMYQRIIDNETAKTRNILNVFEYFCR